MKLFRKEIPPSLAAKILFLSDRTCCVCRKPGKPVQIHHLDDNPGNNVESNLCVLCLDCHTETQISGGFHRKLTSDQIVLYRNDWCSLVAEARSKNMLTPGKTSSPNLTLKQTMVEIDTFTEKKDYTMLAIIYKSLGNVELRDKYVELAMSEGVSDDNYVFLRGSIQKRPDLIPPEVKKRVIDSELVAENWTQLGRIYFELQNYKESIKAYCKGITASLDENNLFTAAFYLKELASRALHVPLFQEELNIREKTRDLWWQLRCLEELGWHTEVIEFLKKNAKTISASDDLFLKQKLFLILGDEKQLLEISKTLAKGTSANKKVAVVQIAKK